MAYASEVEDREGTETEPDGVCEPERLGSVVVADGSSSELCLGTVAGEGSERNDDGDDQTMAYL